MACPLKCLLLKLLKMFLRAMVSIFSYYSMLRVTCFAGTGEFLRNPSICRNLTNFYIWVGFNSTYERGSYLKRTGYTPPSGPFNGCDNNEILVVVSNHRTSQPQWRKVQLHHLVPASPVKKGDYVVILSGDHQGQVTEVLECQRKKQKVKIIINNSPRTYDFSIVCQLTQVV